MWFDSWAGIGRVLLAGAIAYPALVLVLRLSGKRTLSKLNAFDLVVTVAMGSVLASALLNRSVPLAESIAGFATLVLAQYLVARLALRWRRFRGLVTSEPRLLFARGRFLDGALRAERVTRDDVLSAMRGAGAARLEDVGAVLLESDGSLHVVTGQAVPGGGTLAGLRGAPADAGD